MSVDSSTLLTALQHFKDTRYNFNSVTTFSKNKEQMFYDTITIMYPSINRADKHQNNSRQINTIIET
jgi:hypothetical protein